MMKPQLASVTIVANDLPRLGKFYTEQFGWVIMKQNELIIILQLEGTLLSLCTESLFADYTGTKPSQGKSFYFTIIIASAQEVDVLFATLKANNVTIIKMPEYVFWGGYTGFIADPEGNLWELCYIPF